MTRSSRRRSCAPTFGAVVWASHCCGTTGPSDPTASRATRTQARSTSLARREESSARARECVIAEVAYCPPTAMGWSAGAAMQLQRLSQAPPQGDLHSVWWERCRRLCRDRREPSARLRSSLGSQECLRTGGMSGSSTLSRKWALRVRVACIYQPCGQSPWPGVIR